MKLKALALALLFAVPAHAQTITAADSQYTARSWPTVNKLGACVFSVNTSGQIWCTLYGTTLSNDLAHGYLWCPTETKLDTTSTWGDNGSIIVSPTFYRPDGATVARMTRGSDWDDYGHGSLSYGPGTYCTGSGGYVYYEEAKLKTSTATASNLRDFYKSGFTAPCTFYVGDLASNALWQDTDCNDLDMGCGWGFLLMCPSGSGCNATDNIRWEGRFHYLASHPPSCNPECPQLDKVQGPPDGTWHPRPPGPALVTKQSPWSAIKSLYR